MTTIEPNDSFVLIVNELAVGYSKEMPILKNIGFSVKPGELVILAGLNGTGKTTVIKTLFGLIPPLDGSFEWYGISSKGRQTNDFLDQGVRYLGQGSRGFKGYTTMQQYRKVNFVLSKRLMFNPLEKTPSSAFIDTLSYGQKRYLALKSIMPGARTMVLDEPFSGLDEESVLSLVDWIGRKTTEGMSFLLIDHNCIFEKACDIKVKTLSLS